MKRSGPLSLRVRAHALRPLGPPPAGPRALSAAPPTGPPPAASGADRVDEPEAETDDLPQRPLSDVASDLPSPPPVSPAPVPPAPVAPPPLVPPPLVPVWWLTAGGLAGYWPGGSTADAAVLLGVARTIGAYRIGLAGTLGGLCCEGDSGGVRGRRTTVALWARGARRLAQWGRISWHVEAGLGAEYARMTGRSQAFAGPGPEETTDGFALFGRVGTGLRVVLTSRWALEASAGAHLTVPGQRVRLPAGFSGDPLEGPVVAPWGGLTIDFGF